MDVMLSGWFLPASSVVKVIPFVRSSWTLPPEGACFVCSPGEYHADTSLALAFQVDVLSGVGRTQL